MKRFRCIESVAVAVVMSLAALPAQAADRDITESCVLDK